MTLVPRLRARAYHVRAVQRRQGARTDLTAPANALTLADTAEAINLWSITTDRFLDTAWWISTLPAARAYAALWTPASFRRRGIYLDRHDLTHDGVTRTSEPLFDHTALRRAFVALAATRISKSPPRYRSISSR